MECDVKRAILYSQGCLTVLALTQHDENMGKIFVEHKVHLIFFNILNELDGRTETRQLFGNKIRSPPIRGF